MFVTFLRNTKYYKRNIQYYQDVILDITNVIPSNTKIDEFIFGNTG
jgi:hypothetical protein